MSDRRHGSSPQQPPSAADHAEEFGVELDWPEDELAATPPQRGDEAAAPDESKGSASDDASASEAGGDVHDRGWGADTATDARAQGASGVGDAASGGAGPGQGASGVGGDRAAEPGRVDEARDAAADRAEGSERGPAAAAWTPSLVPSRSSTPVPDRGEALNGALSSLAMRIDALVGATSTSRSSITERLNDHIDTVGRLARSQLADLAEFQHTNERALGDVRRSLQGTEELLRRLAAQLDQVSGDVASLQHELDDLRQGQARLSEVAVTGDRHDAHEELTRQVASLRAALEALSEVPDEPLLDDPVASEATLVRLEERVAELGAQRDAPELSAALERIEALLGQQRVEQPGAVGEALVAELQELRAGVDELRAGPGASDDSRASAIVDLRKEVRALRRLIEEALEEPPAPAEPPEAVDVAGTLEAVHRELATMRRRISVRAKPVAIELDDEQTDALAEAVVARLRLLLEVVPPAEDEGPPPEQP